MDASTKNQISSGFALLPIVVIVAALIVSGTVVGMGLYFMNGSLIERESRTSNSFQPKEEFQLGKESAGPDEFEQQTRQQTNQESAELAKQKECADAGLQEFERIKKDDLDIRFIQGHTYSPRYRFNSELNTCLLSYYTTVFNTQIDSSEPRIESRAIKDVYTGNIIASYTKAGAEALNGNNHYSLEEFNEIHARLME